MFGNIRQQLANIWRLVAGKDRSSAPGVEDRRFSRSPFWFAACLACLARLDSAFSHRANAEHVSTLQAQLSQCAAKLTAAENEMALLRRSAGSRLSSVEKERHF